MAIIEGQITLNEIAIAEVDVDPSAGVGLAMPTGSLALLGSQTDGQLWIKYGSGDTAWAIVPRYASGVVFTTGSIPFADSNGYLTQNNANFFWDNNNSRLGVGTIVPSTKIHASSSVNTAITIASTGSGGRAWEIQSNGANGNNQDGMMQVIDRNADLVRFTINQDGKTIVGGNTIAWPSAAGEVSHFQVTGDNGPDSQMSLMRYSADNLPPVFRFTKSRGAEVGVHSVLAINDIMGTVSYRGSDGTNYALGATISSYVDNTIAANSVPGRLQFSTTPLGGTTVTERMRITSAGVVVIGTGATAQDITGASVIPAFQILGTSAFTTQMVAGSFSNDPTPPVFNLIKSRGALNAQAILAADDEIGRLQFRGSDGVNFQAGASVRAAVDGTPVAGSMPGRLLLMTTPAGINAPVERVRITQAGDVGIGNIIPTRQLDISGQMRIRGGSPAAGYVLTAADTSGNANWVSPANINYELCLVDEFLSDSITGQLGWSAAANGGTVSATSSTAYSQYHAGITELTTTAAAQNPTFFLSAGNYIFGNGVTTLQFLVRSPAALPTGAQNHFMRIGFGDQVGNNTNDFANGAYFEFPASGTTAIQYKTATASTRTTISSGVNWTVNTWYLLQMVITGVSNVEFTINEANLQNITTNIPPGNLANRCGVVMRFHKSLGTSTLVWAIDTFGYLKVYSAARY